MNQVEYVEIDWNVLEHVATAEDVAMGIAQFVGEVLLIDLSTGALID